MVSVDRLVESAADKYGDVSQGPFPTEEHERRFGGVLPEFVLGLWRRVGFSGVGHGRMWLVDPLEWAPAGVEMTRGVEVDFLDSDALLVPVARSAFGEMWFWSPGHGVCLSVAPATGSFRARHAQRGDADVAAFSWFAGLQKKSMDIYDSGDRGLFEQALARLGPVGPDECYGFVPSILLGGAAEVGFIEKAKVREHLRLLDMIRRGEFTVEVGPRLDVGEDRGVGVGAVEPQDVSHLLDVIVDAARTVASEDEPSWEVAVVTSVQDEPRAFGHDLVVYESGRGRRVRLLAYPEELARMQDATLALAKVQGYRWLGLKVTVLGDGRREVAYEFARKAALRWTTGVEGAPSREELPEVLRPEGW